MTNKQKQFADEYLIDLNATRAYKAVYKNIKNNHVAETNGNRLLRNAEVKEYVDQQLQKISDAKIADATEVMQYLTSVLRGESTSDIVVVEGLGDGVSEARQVSKTPDEKERLKAAELLGKRYGIYSDKVNITGAVPIVISGDDELDD